MTRRGDNTLQELIATMRPQDAAFFRRTLSRRALLRDAAVAGAAAATLGSAASALAGQATPTGDLPEDAAPPEDQILRVAGDPGTARALDFYESVYGGAGAADVFSVPLVRLNREFELEPAAATDWSSNEDGTVWTFKLLDTLMWSDGNPVTAADYVKTFQYAADPEHAWDFTWFWNGDIVNFEEAVAGDVPVEEIGVKQGANEYEVVFEMINPAPYLPAKLVYSVPLSKAALETSGAYYNNDPKTAVSSGPFIIEEWLKDQQLTLKRNDAYSEDKTVPLQKIIVKYAAPNTYFTLYEADQIDMTQNPAPAEIQLMEADPERANEIYQGVGSFACFYFFFDVTKAPFDDLKVRQAFSHVLDRDALKQQVWGRQANAAYGFLAPGFPASNNEGLKDIQSFDPETAKQLLADAGYPDGKDFPKLTLQVRGGAIPVETATTQAYGNMLKEHLNIDVEIQSVDRQAFYDALSAKPTEIPFGWISYGMDYFDASNMLGVWKSGGRHSWSNPDFDAKVAEASTFLGDEEERTAMFQEAEKILVEDCPAVFAYFETPIQLIKPYFAGAFLEPDSNGIQAIHWPGFSMMSTVLFESYVSNKAPSGRE